MGHAGRRGCRDGEEISGRVDLVDCEGESSTQTGRAIKAKS